MIYQIVYAIKEIYVIYCEECGQVMPKRHLFMLFAIN